MRCNNTPFVHHSVIFDQTIDDCSPLSPYSPDLPPCDFCLFPKLKLELKGCHIDTIETMQTESQVVLDTFTEADFQTFLKSLKKAGSDAYVWVETTLKVTAVKMCKGMYLARYSSSAGTFG